ncbi:pyocin knob domain-containing protein [Arthrobacter sp. UYCu712]|uniref:pyocin knob domain-containing protein n=1 Tax=Arthrobacter sp. UYCu712 TaxID=3156340 RepID=UPI0033979A79
MSLPSNVSTGKVSGQFVIAVGDGPDPENPTVTYPVQGTVEFQASVDYWPDPTATAPVTILSEIVVGILDGSGRLCTPDPGDETIPTVPWVKLIATDDPDLMALNWTWTATYKFLPRNGRPVSQIPAHSLAVPSNSVIDLASVVKVPSSPGVGIDQVTIIAAQAFASANAAAASATAAANSATAAAGSVTAANTYTDQQVALRALLAHTHLWADLTNKPTTFAPIVGATATTAKAGNWFPAWTEVTAKPATFAPAAHTHPLSDVTVTEIPDAADLDTYVTSGYYSQSQVADAVSGLNYPLPQAGLLEVVTFGVFTFQWYTGYATQYRKFWRTKYSTFAFNAWQEVAPVGHTHAAATASVAGFLSTTDKAKLDKNSYAGAAGTVAVGIIAAGASTSITITYPASRFSVAPILNVNSGDGRVTVGAITANSATSATVTLNNYTAAASVAATAQWQARQMTSTTAAG